jgi:hypothetical protein
MILCRFGRPQRLKTSDGRTCHAENRKNDLKTAACRGRPRWGGGHRTALKANQGTGDSPDRENCRRQKKEWIGQRLVSCNRQSINQQGRQKSGGTSFVDFVWKALAPIEMKKRGADLVRHYQQAFDF